MWYQSMVHPRCLPFWVMALSFLTAPVMDGRAFGLPASQEGKPAASQGRTNPSVEAGKRDEKAEGKDQESLKSKSAKHINESVSASRERKKELAMSVLERVIASAHRITPDEYGLLIQVEAATQLWQFDKERSLALIKEAWDAMLELLEAQKGKANDDKPSRKQQRLRFAVLRRIAKLSPDILKQLVSNNLTAESTAAKISGKWTDEARAIMSVAEEQIESNPTLAAQLAQQSLSLGLVDWAPFLTKLSQRDSARAEQVAAWLIVQFNSSSVSPSDLLHLDRFVLGQDRSPSLREQYFRALADRLALDLRSDTPIATLRLGLQTAQMTRGEATGSRWPMKFQEIISQYEVLLSARSSAPSVAPRSVAVDTSMMNPSTAGDTSEIEKRANAVPKISDSTGRDKEYQRLAASAARYEDMRLAEDLMSKIDNDNIRRETSISVYGPVIRKSLSEADWMKAQTNALKISHPLGRALVLDIIAQIILRSEKGKQDEANQVYDAALWELRRDGSTEGVAKGFLIIARSLATKDPDRSLEALLSAIFVLNKLTRNGELFVDSDVGGALASWVSLPVQTIRYDEALDFTEIIGPLFKAMAQRDPRDADSTALRFAHLGLSSLAELGIVSELLNELRTSNRALPERSPKNQSEPRQ